MSSASFNKRDLNRFRKIYPYNRKRERLSIVPSAEGFKIEVGTAAFVNQTSVTVNFTELFSSIPIVTSVSVDTSGNSQANVNISISAVSAVSVTFEASMVFTGTVHYHAIQVQ